MLSFEELVFINKDKVMFKVTQVSSPIYTMAMLISKDTMPLRSN